MVAVPLLSALLTMPPPTANVHPLFRNGIFIFPKTATNNSKAGTYVGGTFRRIFHSINSPPIRSWPYELRLESSAALRAAFSARIPPRKRPCWAWSGTPRLLRTSCPRWKRGRRTLCCHRRDRAINLAPQRGRSPWCPCRFSRRLREASSTFSVCSLKAKYFLLFQPFSARLYVLLPVLI